MSRPTWARGLKQTIVDLLANESVAPHVGAWIETSNDRVPKKALTVAPHVGAWIET